MARGARAQGERVGHNDTVNDVQMTSENIELVPLQEDDSTRRIPIVTLADRHGGPRRARHGGDPLLDPCSLRG